MFGESRVDMISKKSLVMWRREGEPEDQATKGARKDFSRPNGWTILGRSAEGWTAQSWVEGLKCSG